MNSSGVSPIESLNTAINSQNPFEQAGIVKEQEVWGKGFPDVPTLNQHASDLVFQAIEKVKTSQSIHEKVTSIAITAEQGVGKSHLISRIRHRIEREGGALFVYASVNKYTDLNLIDYQFQQTLAESLRNTGSERVMQWQEVATAMVNEVNTNNSQNPTELVRKFDKAYTNSLAQNKNLMNALQNKILKAKTNADRYIVRSILWTVSEDYGTAAINWLSGKDLSQADADYLGLPNSSKTSQERNAEALNNVRQIINLVSYYNPVIICLDEIDVKNNCNDSGLSTEQVIADLVKRLYDTLEHSEVGRGVVIITVMLPVTWRDKVDSIPGGTPDRVSKYTQRKPISLDYLNAKSMVDLVTIWLTEFYEARNLTPPHPVYPFEEDQLKDYGKKKPTVRQALKWCAENFKVYMPVMPENPVERFDLALARQLEAIPADYIENNELLAEVISFGFQTLKGQILEGETLTGEKLNQVKIEDVTEIKPKTENKGWINFKVIGTEKEKVVKIGVAVIQSNQLGLVAGLKRLKDYETFDLNRGCLVRSKSKIEQIKKNSEAYKLLKQLVSEKGGEVVDLIEDQIKPLIAVHSVYQRRDDYNLTEQQIFDLISQKRLTIDNPLLLEILSDPSGEMPNGGEDDDGIIDDFLNESIPDNKDDSDEVDDFLK